MSHLRLRADTVWVNQQTRDPGDELTMVWIFHALARPRAAPDGTPEIAVDFCDAELPAIGLFSMSLSASARRELRTRRQLPLQLDAGVISPDPPLRLRLGSQWPGIAVNIGGGTVQLGITVDFHLRGYVDRQLRGGGSFDFVLRHQVFGDTINFIVWDPDVREMLQDYADARERQQNRFTLTPLDSSAPLDCRGLQL